VRGPDCSRMLDHATAHPSDSTAACSNTVCVAFSCLSYGSV
jgi:hypothetical protein